uniref:Protein kinase domain-containing protein n=1 Tax=Parastrongyloides trichosuri TaxID=131310 RepID=A0A0N4Z775_PARTI
MSSEYIVKSWKSLKPTRKPVCIKNRYQINHELGRGSFGVVLDVKDLVTLTPLAIKIAKKNDNEGKCLVLEKRILKKVRGSDHFATIYVAGTYKKYNYIIFEKLGRNLQTIMFEKNDEKSFHPCVIAEIGQQLIEALNTLHGAGYLHRDIKPDNMMIGLPPNNNKIYLIDFGMGRRFKNSDGSIRKTKRRNLCFRGTKVFASCWALSNNEQQPWEDINCVLTSIAFMLNGTLPWWDSYNDTLKLIEEKKRMTCMDMFIRFGYNGRKFAAYVLRSMHKYEIDYKYMINCLKQERDRLDKETFDAYWTWDLNWTEILINPYANNEASIKNVALGLGAAGVAGAGGLIFALENSINAGEHVVHPCKLPWPHAGMFDSFDYASVRRGYEVYKQVCAACHSMKFIHYRHFVDTFMTLEEAKAEAAEATIPDINDKGQSIMRPGTVNDILPDPYPNKKAAAAANNGAAPPDLSLMSLARHGGDDYIFALLTGYFDPPAGVKVDDGKAYNPYFPGGVISMPQQLFDEGIEYKDGTFASQSQQAKDVSVFLHWAAEPFHDTRKLWALKIAALIPILTVVLIYGKRHSWSFIKTQKFAWRTVKGREPPKSK